MEAVDIASKINTCIVTVTEKLGVNLFNFSKVLEERYNLETLDEWAYSLLAGQVLNISSYYVANDLEVFSQYNEDKDEARQELDVLSRYLSTLLIKNLFPKHGEALKEAETVLLNSRLVWDSNFKSLLHLVVLFDCPRTDSKYRNLVVPLADTCVRVMHRHFTEGDLNDN